MEKVFVPYKPRWSDIHKYSTFLQYLKEYLAFGDFRSVRAAMGYVLANKLPGQDYVTSSRMGKFWIRKGTNDFQYVNYVYERRVKRYIHNHLDSFDVFIDVGACIGEYCIWLSHFGKRCIAFDPVNHKAVERNVALNNKRPLVQVFPFGLGRRKEKLYFNILPDATGSSYADRSQADKEPNVQIEALDDWTQQLHLHPDDRVLMKVDTEGMEEEVFEGARQFIRNHRNLSIIYERYRTKNEHYDQVLANIADFEFSDIDSSNRLAVKK